MKWITKQCPECGHKVRQPDRDTAPTFCTCKTPGPQMVAPPLPEDDDGTSA